MTAVRLTMLAALALNGALPPLSAEQQQQLETTQDLRGALDEAGLYPLLWNASEWPAGDESGATVPDYERLLTAPAEARGQLFLIEGDVIAAGGLADRLSRPGPWDPTLQRWVIQPDQRRGDLVLVLLTDPPPVRVGQRVRLPARFYKVWNDEAHQPPRAYAVLVGRGATLFRPPAGGSATPGAPALIVAAIALAGGGLWFWARRLARTRASLGEPRPWRTRAALAEARASSENEPQDGPPLPESPAAALEELERRHDGATEPDREPY
jgi:hypothetical protein